MDSGNLLVFGNNKYGQLGLGDNINRYTPTLLTKDRDIKMIHCGGYHSIIHKINGDLLVFGLNKYGQLGLGNNKNKHVPTLLMNDKNIKNICCFRYHTMIYRNNGDLLFFGGYNKYMIQSSIINE